MDHLHRGQQGSQQKGSACSPTRAWGLGACHPYSGGLAQ